MSPPKAQKQKSGFFSRFFSKQPSTKDVANATTTTTTATGEQVVQDAGGQQQVVAKPPLKRVERLNTNAYALSLACLAEDLEEKDVKAAHDILRCEGCEVIFSSFDKVITHFALSFTLLSSRSNPRIVGRRKESMALLVLWKEQQRRRREAKGNLSSYVSYDRIRYEIRQTSCREFDCRIFIYTFPVFFSFLLALTCFI